MSDILSDWRAGGCDTPLAWRDRVLDSVGIALPQRVFPLVDHPQIGVLFRDEAIALLDQLAEALSMEPMRVEESAQQAKIDRLEDALYQIAGMDAGVAEANAAAVAKEAVRAEEER